MTVKYVKSHGKYVQDAKGAIFAKCAKRAMRAMFAKAAMFGYHEMFAMRAMFAIRAIITMLAHNVKLVAKNAWTMLK